MKQTLPAPGRRGRRRRRALQVLGLAMLAGCGSSSGVASFDGDPSRDLDPAYVVSAAQLQRWQAEIDDYNGGFRPAGSEAEIAYTKHLVARLRDMGVDAQLDPYEIARWTLQRAALELLPAGGDAQPVALASYIPMSGATGADGISGNVVYMPGLAAVDLSGVIVGLLNGSSGAGELPQRIADLLADTGSAVAPVLAALASADVAGKIVLYDVPKPTIPVGALTTLAFHVSDPDGSLPFTTPYSRPFLDMVVVQVINTALKTLGAAGAVGVIDYPAAAANGSYYPVFAPTLPTVPTVYVDRDTGRALKAQLGGGSVSRARLVLDATVEQTQAYNVDALIPGVSADEIIVSSHTDGTNSIEDNGPAAILGIARYFTRIPRAQRPRSLRIVFSGAHFAGSPGLSSYVAGHRDALQANARVAIEIEHLGAREWLETEAGMMALTGLDEPQVIMTPGTAAFRDASIRFADRFKRFIVLPPLLPFGEGHGFGNAGVPVIQYITGPVYLLNDGLPAVTTQFTDYGLMQRQTQAFIEMILELGNAEL